MTTSSAVPVTLMEAREYGAPPLHRLLLGLAQVALEKVSRPLTGAGQVSADVVEHSRAQAWSA